MLLNQGTDGIISLKVENAVYAQVNGKTFTIKQNLNGLEATILAEKK